MIESVAIVGVGLIGGSFALALRAAGFRGRIVGVSSPRTISEALRLQVIDAGLTLEEACAQADLVYLAGPIQSIIDLIPRLDDLVKPAALVTDAGSTKSLIARAGARLKRAQFLGGHPMAGKEKRGVAEAEAALFRCRPYLLTPAAAQDMETAAAREFAGWVRAIGADVRVVSPEEHDRLVAHSSHLPQLLSTTLAAMLAQRDDAERIRAAAGPGLLDMSRLALSAWDIWHDILATNREEILAALDECSLALAEVRALLAEDRLEARFGQAAAFARELRK